MGLECKRRQRRRAGASCPAPQPPITALGGVASGAWDVVPDARWEDRASTVRDASMCNVQEKRGIGQDTGVHIRRRWRGKERRWTEDEVEARAKVSWHESDHAPWVSPQF
jgi:hypothetical protein